VSSATTAVLLTLCVATGAICCIALVIVKDVFNRMHYLAPITSVAVLALLVAVVVQEGWGQAALKSILIVFILFLVNAVLTHATARAARIRQFGHWLPKPEENIAGTPRRNETSSG